MYDSAQSSLETDCEDWAGKKILKRGTGLIVRCNWMEKQVLSGLAKMGLNELKNVRRRRECPCKSSLTSWLCAGKVNLESFRMQDETCANIFYLLFAH